MSEISNTGDIENIAHVADIASMDCDDIVNACLQKIFAATSEDDAMGGVLPLLGSYFGCDRLCVFQVEDERWINTEFEWCAEGIASRKDQIRNEPIDHFGDNFALFDQSDVGLLRDIETIRSVQPTVYALMKSRQATSLAFLSFQADNGIAGMFCVENPDLSKSDAVVAVLEKVGVYIKALLQRRTVLRQLEEMSFHDQLTGAFNRNALTKLSDRPLPMKSVGIIFCDISGLKHVNDTQGHEAGDEMIVQCYRLIQKAVRTGRIYRMGGDEFMALCSNATHDDVERDFENLKSAITASPHHIAAGFLWSDKQPLMLEELITKADQDMYADKQKYYSTRDNFVRVAKSTSRKRGAVAKVEEESAFQKYLKNYYFDAEALLKAITVNNMNQFFFFGDVQKNWFYVSDHYRDRFGFESNLLLNLPHHWEQRICGEEFKKVNSDAVNRLFAEKQDYYELLHQVQDVHGDKIYVHNSGTLQWNEDKTVPLFLCGRITLQDKDYTVDQISGFQKDFQALMRLETLQAANQPVSVIGYCLNHFSKVNKGTGTYDGNMLLYKIGRRLLSEMNGKMTFYRLDGLNFAAVLEPEYADKMFEVLEEVRTAIEKEYAAIEVYDEHPASFAVVQYQKEMGTPQEFLETVREMIDTAQKIPNIPYVTISEEKQEEIEKTQRMISVLRRNIENNMQNFTVVVQPAVHADSKLLAGGESLLRWKYEDREMLPEELLPLLEKEGLLAQVDRWVIEQTISAESRLRDCASDFILTFNVSGQALHSEGFEDFVEETLARYGLKKHNFYAELNESDMMAWEGEINSFIARCKKLGISITQKKFGALNSLFKAGMEHNADVLKLDVALLDSLETVEAQDNYLQSLVYLCHKFDKRICVTDVESEAQHDQAARCGCDYVEGYYHYHPLTLSELYKLLLVERVGVSPM